MASSSKNRKPTKQESLLYETAKSADLKATLAKLRGDAKAKSTQNSYNSNVKKYEEVIEIAREKEGFGHLKALPVTKLALEIFAGVLKESEAYKTPAPMIFAVLDANKERKHEYPLQGDDLSDILTSLERGMSDAEQAFPLGVIELRKMAAAVRNEVDFDVWLSVAGAFFTLSRIDSFLSMTLGDVSFSGEGSNSKVTIKLSNLKSVEGWKASKKHLEFELEQVEGYEKFEFPQGFGSIPCCPVRVFRVITGRARRLGRNIMSGHKDYQQFSRRLAVFVEQAGMMNHIEGRTRALYTAHSTRVGGVCTLIRAGLKEMVVSAVANWSSDQVAEYARKVMLMPSIAEPVKFYNPIAMAANYAGSADASGCGPAAKRLKRCGAGMGM